MGFLIGGYSNAGTIDPSAKDSDHIEYGSKHKCVQKIVSIFDGEKHNGSCVFIKPNVIITAAHIPFNSDETFVEFEDGKKILVDIIVYRKEFFEEIADSKNILEYDIAVCHTNENVSDEYCVGLYDKHDENGKICSIAGYGISGTYDGKKYSFDSKKRAGTNIVSETKENTIECSIDDKPKTSLEFFIQSGDSGGGLFIDGKLAGINSYIYGFKNEPQKTSAHTRISKNIDWIRSTIKIFEEFDKLTKE